MQAVILAAGQGQRIRAHHTKPKGFIEINDTPLIMYSLEALRSHGIDDITIVTGYRHECYDQLANETGWFKTVYNPEYATYGNLYSFYAAKQVVNQDVLLVESDIIYESRSIDHLLNSTQQDVILVSGPTNSGDEVYIQTQQDILIDMSKQRDTLDTNHILGEFVGLTRLSHRTCSTLFELCDQDAQLCHEGYYDEDGLVKLSAVNPLSCLLVENLQWSEIDNLDHLERARLLFPHSPLSTGVAQ